VDDDMEWVNDDDEDDDPEISHVGGEREDRVRSAVEYIILPRYLFHFALHSIELTLILLSSDATLAVELHG
jgi:hypothetical protein